MSEDVKTCSRTGCGKKLKESNTKGVCSSGCRSLEAPVYQRAPELRDGAPTRRKPKKSEEPPAGAEPDAEEGAYARFRVVAQALGRDPDALIEAFAQGWLDALRERLE